MGSTKVQRGECQRDVLFPDGREDPAAVLYNSLTDGVVITGARAEVFYVLCQAHVQNTGMMTRQEIMERIGVTEALVRSSFQRIRYILVRKNYQLAQTMQNRGVPMKYGLVALAKPPDDTQPQA